MAKKGTTYSGLDLSEQQIVDCGYDGKNMNGCNGAIPGKYEDWWGNKATMLNSHEAQYPYQEASPNLQCLKKPAWSTGNRVTKAISKFLKKYYHYSVRIFSIILVDYNCNAERMKQLVYEYGAVSTAMFAGHTAFFQYKQGIFQGKCSQDAKADHAVVVVGYGSEHGVDYWIVKNSHGSHWGENGYMKIRRGTNECAIEKYCFALECDSYGSYTQPPVAPPSPPAPLKEYCDVSKLYKRDDLTGEYTLKVNGKKQKKCHIQKLLKDTS